MRKRFPQIIKLIQEQIRSHVANDELNAASKLLVEAIEAFAKYRLNEALILAGGVKCFEKKLHQGVWDYRTASEEKNKLFLRILDIIESLLDEDNIVD